MDKRNSLVSIFNKGLPLPLVLTPDLLSPPLRAAMRVRNCRRFTLLSLHAFAMSKELSLRYWGTFRYFYSARSQLALIKKNKAIPLCMPFDLLNVIVSIITLSFLIWCTRIKALQWQFAVWSLCIKSAYPGATNGEYHIRKLNYY